MKVTITDTVHVIRVAHVLMVKMAVVDTIAVRVGPTRFRRRFALNQAQPHPRQPSVIGIIDLLRHDRNGEHNLIRRPPAS